MNEDGRALVEALHREAAEQARGQPWPPAERPTIHFTELPEAQPGDVLYSEWNTYRREVGRLLSEGHEGKFVLIKGEETIGLWDTLDEARDVALQRFLMQPVLIRQILEREPLPRVRGYNFPWPTRLTR